MSKIGLTWYLFCCKMNDNFELKKMYTSKIFTIKELNEPFINDLESLYLKNYNGSNSLIFRKDLKEKNYILCIYFNEELIGFSTLQNYIHEFRNKKYSIIFSGDTIVDKAHWGQQSLAKEWIGLVKKIKSLSPELELFWFLIVKGHRTYKYLNAFAKEYFPKFDNEVLFLKDLAYSLAAEKFKDNFNKELGLIQYDNDSARLVEDLADISDEQCKNVNTQFFLEKNPNYKNGDELVCCCSLETTNMNPITLRFYNRF